MSPINSNNESAPGRLGQPTPSIPPFDYTSIWGLRPGMRTDARAALDREIAGPYKVPEVSYPTSNVRGAPDEDILDTSTAPQRQNNLDKQDYEAANNFHMFSIEARISEQQKRTGLKVAVAPSVPDSGYRRTQDLLVAAASSGIDKELYDDWTFQDDTTSNEDTNITEGYETDSDATITDPKYSGDEMDGPGSGPRESHCSRGLKNVEGTKTAWKPKGKESTRPQANAERKKSKQSHYAGPPDYLLESNRTDPYANPSKVVDSDGTVRSLVAPVEPVLSASTMQPVKEKLPDLRSHLSDILPPGDTSGRLPNKDNSVPPHTSREQLDNKPILPLPRRGSFRAEVDIDAIAKLDKNNIESDCLHSVETIVPTIRSDKGDNIRCTSRFQRGVYGTYDEFAGPKLYHQDATASKFSNVRNSHGLRVNDPSRVNGQYGAEDDDSDTEDRLRREYNERKRKYSPTPEYDPPMPEIDDMRIPPHLHTWRRAVSGKITKQTQAQYEQERTELLRRRAWNGEREPERQMTLQMQEERENTEVNAANPQPVSREPSKKKRKVIEKDLQDGFLDFQSSLAIEHIVLKDEVRRQEEENYKVMMSRKWDHEEIVREARQAGKPKPGRRNSRQSPSSPTEKKARRMQQKVADLSFTITESMLPESPSPKRQSPKRTSSSESNPPATGPNQEEPHKQ